MGFLTFIMLNFIGAISPGPDFAIISRYGLSGSRKSAIFATLGITLALVIHSLYCVTGVAIFLQSSPRLISLIKIAGSAYLSFLGVKILFDLKKKEKVDTANSKNAFAAGFFTNLLNPKATVFMLSLFGLFAESMETPNMKIAFAASVPLVALIWFLFLSVFMTNKKFLPFLQKHQKSFLLVMGGVLLLLGGLGTISGIYSLI